MCSRTDLENLLLDVSQVVETLKLGGHPAIADALSTKYIKVAESIGFTGRLNLFNNLLRKQP